MPIMKKGLFDTFKAIDSGKSKTTNNNTNKKPESSKKYTNNTKTVSNNTDDNWKSFYSVRPDILIPLECYIDTGSKKEYFYAYLTDGKVLCTNDPYRGIVLRHKYNNMYYREISGCKITDCVNGFPDCKNCKRGKSK
jgi:hypothetical protein